MNTASDRWIKLKIFLVLELVMVLIAFVLPITPSKTGAPFAWPPDLITYLHRVVESFLLGNGLVLVLAGLVWVYWVWQGRPDWGKDEADPTVTQDRESPS